MKPKVKQYSITEGLRKGEFLTMDDIYGPNPIVLQDHVNNKRKQGERHIPLKRNHLPLKYRQYISRAKSKEIEFNLSLEEFNALIPGKCVYCGLPSNTIDRRDSSAGYISSNCCPCCKVCNSMKNTLSTGAFLKHITLIYTYLLNK